MRRKNSFGRLPGIILDFPGEAFSGPGRAVTQPQDLRFWGAKKKLLGGSRGSFWVSPGVHCWDLGTLHHNRRISHFGAQKHFWEAPGDHFGLPGTWARCIKTWHYFGFLGVHYQRHPCSLSPKIQKIDVSEQGGFVKIIPRRHFWHLHQKTEGFQRP